MHEPGKQAQHGEEGEPLGRCLEVVVHVAIGPQEADGLAKCDIPYAVGGEVLDLLGEIKGFCFCRRRQV